jgi:hypothetical protein
VNADEFEIMRRKHHRERLITHLQQLTGETRRVVVVKALEERIARLTLPVTPIERAQRIVNILERSIWQLGRPGFGRNPIERAEEDGILGYRPEGI